MITQEQRAEMVANEINSICNKYGVEIGVWLTWRDLYKNLELLANNAEIKELHFGVHIRFNDVINDKAKKRNESAAKRSKSGRGT